MNLMTLRPVGYPVNFTRKADNYLQDYFSPYNPKFFNSGTEALAAAINIACNKKGSAQPEVIVPAYACPDILSAVIFNNAKPVLIDMLHEKPWLDLEDLKKSITPNTVAIIAISFLGIREQLPALKDLSNANNLLLIEDSAQALPREDEQALQGDLAIVSFGRGKPASVLGGGCLLSKELDAFNYISKLVQNKQDDSWQKKFIFYGKTFTYNLLLSRFTYWLPNHLPFLKLGMTQYHPLTELSDMNHTAKMLLPANIQAYRKRKNTQHHVQQALRDALKDSFIDLPSVTGTLESNTLLRYPILLPTPEMKRKLSSKTQHLGSSALYPRLLNQYPEVHDQIIAQSTFPNSLDFCSRLLTFPTYEGYPVDTLHNSLKEFME